MRYLELSMCTFSYMVFCCRCKIPEPKFLTEMRWGEIFCGAFERDCTVRSTRKGSKWKRCIKIQSSTIGMPLTDNKLWSKKLQIGQILVPLSIHTFSSYSWSTLTDSSPITTEKINLGCSTTDIPLLSKKQIHDHFLRWIWWKSYHFLNQIETPTEFKSRNLPPQVYELIPFENSRTLN